MTPAGLRRSESASSTRPNRYIYVNNHAYIVIDLLGKGGSSEVRFFVICSAFINVFNLDLFEKVFLVIIIAFKNISDFN